MSHLDLLVFLAIVSASNVEGFSCPLSNTKMLFPSCSVKKVVCVSDLHGNLPEARALWAKLEQRIGAQELRNNTAVVFLGDFCDRGPNTNGVLDWLIALKKELKYGFFLAGNHDFGMQSFLGCVPPTPSQFTSDLSLDSTKKEAYVSGFWPHNVPGGMHYQGRRWGGTSIYEAEQTFASYGVSGFDSNGLEVRDAFLAAVPDAHKQFLSDLSWVVEVECREDEAKDPTKIVCVHAGLSLDKDVASQLEALRAREWRSPALHEQGDAGRIEAFSGRGVLNHPDLIQNKAVLVSGHHGKCLVDRENLRAIVDENGGFTGMPLQAIVFPEWELVYSH
mmetsp:Transcript_27248/g.55635  ORF Transcript_27248/g.55635 Transcript_27248/m.55635 type:complete len:334 (-) Transcript_27248:101-1102(-)